MILLPWTLPLSCGKADSSPEVLWLRKRDELGDFRCFCAFFTDLRVNPSTFSVAETADMFAQVAGANDIAANLKEWCNLATKQLYSDSRTSEYRWHVNECPQCELSWKVSASLHKVIHRFPKRLVPHEQVKVARLQRRFIKTPSCRRAGFTHNSQHIDLGHLLTAFAENITAYSTASTLVTLNPRRYLLQSSRYSLFDRTWEACSAV